MKRMAISLLLAAAGIAAFAADPYAGYIYPAGISAGTTNRFIIGGQMIGGARGVHFGNPRLHVLKIEKVPNFAPPTAFQRKHLKSWPDGIAAGRMEEPPKPNDPHLNEWRSNSWWRALNTLDASKLAIVEHYLYTQRNALQDTPSLRQMLLVTVAADANAPTGRCEFAVWGWNGISAPRPFSVSAAARTKEPLYVPPHRTQPEAPLVDVRNGDAVLDGQIMPGTTDAFRLQLAGGRRYSVAVTARELQPYIGDAVPGFFNAAIVMKDSAGRVVAEADDDARFRPDPRLNFTPAADGEYRLEIHDVLYRGRADFVYAIAVGDAMDNTPPKADGVVTHPGAVSVKSFTIDEPGPRILEVTARRKGSPLDAVLTLKKADGPVIAHWDDVTNTVFTGTIPQEESDPIGIYDFKEPGSYVAEVTDRTGHGGMDYAWWLDIRRPTQDFEVRSTRSTLPLKRWQPLKVDFIVRRKDGFSGDVALEFPDSIRAKNAVITAGVEKVTAELYYTGKRTAEIRPISLFARGTANGRTVRNRVIPCDDYEQAFAWHHLVPAKDFLFMGFPGNGKNNNPKHKRK